MNDPRDYKLDISSVQPPAEAKDAGKTDRPFIGVKFECCSVYLRIYRDADGSGYHGACPRCGKRVSFAVGAGGTTARTFVVR
jgi:hypothetical protein